jgi:hypothetical protein
LKIWAAIRYADAISTLYPNFRSLALKIWAAIRCPFQIFVGKNENFRQSFAVPANFHFSQAHIAFVISHFMALCVFLPYIPTYQSLMS